MTDFLYPNNIQKLNNDNPQKIIKNPSKWQIYLVLVSTIILSSIAVITAFRLYQTREESIAPSAPEKAPAQTIAAGCDIQFNVTIPGTIAYLTVIGSTDQPLGITMARFRINGGAWQETTLRRGNEFYIEYTFTEAGNYHIEAQVYNPVLGWL